MTIDSVRDSRSFDGLTVRITSNCVGSGQCALLAPEAFRLDSDGLSTLADPLPPDIGAESLLTAVQACPTGAIEIEEST